MQKWAINTLIYLLTYSIAKPPLNSLHCYYSKVCRLVKPQ